MGLLTKKYFAWNEPWFFVPRERHLREWAIMGTLCFAVGFIIALSAILIPGRLQGDIVKCSVIFLGVSFVIYLILDAANWMRTIDIDEKEIFVSGEAGFISSLTKIPHDTIHMVQIDRNTEVNRPYHRLTIWSGTKQYTAGIPKKIDLEKLAQVLHTLTGNVALQGWVPATGPISNVTESLLDDPNSKAAIKLRGTEQAILTPVPSNEPLLVTITDRTIAGLIAGWPLLFGLVGLVGGIGYAIWNWRILGILDRILWIGSPIVVAVVLFAIVARFANYLETGYNIRAAKKALKRRTGVIVSNVDQALPITQIDRKFWTDLMPKQTDFGFFAAEVHRQMFLFEGNKERWEIPYGAIVICQVEQVDVGVQTESGQQAKRWLVNLTVNTPEGHRELGIRLSNQRIGAENDKMREELANELLDYIAVTLEAN